MMNDFLIKALLVSPETITRVVIAVCLLLLMLPLMPGFRRLRTISPGLMISVGILGTFWGTLIALHEFKTANHTVMLESIPFVIGGMKVAFITSLIGLFAAFVAKIAYAYIPVKEGDDGEGTSWEEKSLVLLHGIRDAINGKQEGSLFAQFDKIQGEFRDGMGTLADAIGRHSDGSLQTKVTILGDKTAHGLKQVEESLAKVDESLGEFKTQTGDHLGTMSASLVKIDEQAGKSLEQGIQANENLAKVDGSVVAMNQQVNESLDGMKTQTRESLEAIGESLVKVDEQAGKSLEQDIQTNANLTKVDDSLTAMNRQVNESLDGLKTQIDDRLSAMTDSLVKIDEQTGKSLEQGTQANENLLKIDTSLAVLNERVGAALEELVAEAKNSLVKLDQINEHMAGLSDAIRNSLVENLNQLIDEIKTTIAEELVNQMKETNRVLGEELHAMTQRIEHALIDQFGQTFKQFNEATHAIKDWQEEHKGQVERLTEAFETSAAGIGQIRKDCESIPQSMAELNAIIGALNERVEAFADMRERALDAFPAIEERLNKIANDLAAAASGFDGLEGTIKGLEANIQKAMDKMAEKMDTLADDYTKAVNGVVQEITQKWGDRMVAISERVAQRLREDGR